MDVVIALLLVRNVCLVVSVVGIAIAQLMSPWAVERTK